MKVIDWLSTNHFNQNLNPLPVNPDYMCVCVCNAQLQIRRKWFYNLKFIIIPSSEVLRKENCKVFCRYNYGYHDNPTLMDGHFRNISLTTQGIRKTMSRQKSSGSGSSLKLTASFPIKFLCYRHESFSSTVILNLHPAAFQVSFPFEPILDVEI